MKQGYHQLLLDPESRNVATFSTPWGNMRPKRLIFGAKSSQDLFDETIGRIFGDIPYCLNQRDDILIGGKTLEDHNETLRTVLQRAADFNITFNEDKCCFAVEEIEFYGYLFTKDGLKPTDDKVKAVKESKPPQSKEEVRSFLGMIGYLSKFIPRYSILTAPLRALTQKDIKFKWGTEEQKAFDNLKQSITSDDVVAYFNPSKEIILRTEASFHEGLSAGLFQRTEKGVQPVHFISRSMTKAEKRYSQTEKDALAIQWAKNRFRMYLLGAPRFKIVTAHKPLIPMFNKPTTKLPPRIEKWVMEMQDVDYEVVYEPGKDEADPLDFLSRHPLPETGSDETEVMVKYLIEDEHAVVIDKIRKETEKDPQLNKVKQRLMQNDWEEFRKDEDIKPFYPIRQQLYIAKDIIFRLECIVIPSTLRRKVIHTAHKMGHLGMTKTKQLLREKYWFPEMNRMTEDVIGQCYECQVTTKQHVEEPIKTTPIPEEPWDVVSIDFGGPYPDGHYNLVVIDKRTRYPEVETTRSTSFKATKSKLKRIFATHGIPNKVETDNGPPFNSQEFQRFAQEEGFIHHKVTPDHPRANGEAENFMKILNKTEQIAHLQKEDREIAIQTMLMGYRAAPHPATQTPPYEALMGRPVRTKLDHTTPHQVVKDKDKQINQKDKDYKEKGKKLRENRNTKTHSFVVGDFVLLKQNKKNKWTTAFEPAFYVVYRIDGSSVAARRVSDGRQIYRDASHFKLVNAVVQNMENYPGDQTNTPRQEDWREVILQETTQDAGDSNTTGPTPDQPIQKDASTNKPIQPIQKEGCPTTPPRPNQRDCPTTPPPPRRPVRMRKTPPHLKDFVTKF